MVTDTFIPLDNIDIQHAVYDLDFEEIKKWKESHPGKKVIGTFPVYVPPELIHAFGHLPVNLFGGGEKISISHADAILGSFICSVSKSTTELMLGNQVFQRYFDGYVFPFICDVARNLSGIFQRRSDKPSYMLHLSQNFESEGSIKFLSKEYRRMVETLFPDEELNLNALKESIVLFNENRRLQREIYQFRSEQPWNVPLADLYLVMRVGSVIDVARHNAILTEYLSKIKKNQRTERDAIRIVITGNFCEQPPLDIVDLIEKVGCYVIDDEFMIGRRYIIDDIDPDADDLLAEMSRSYIHKGKKLATRFHEGEKGEIMMQRVNEANADGVVFLTAKFCEPALDDLVLQQHVLHDNDITSVHIEYEERGSGYENIRLSLETFVESMLFE